MKTYKIKVSFFDRPPQRIQATEKKIRVCGNVNDYVFNKLGAFTYKVKTIEVIQFNEHTKRQYKTLTFHYQFAQWRNDHTRIEAINDEGYEDLTGYGNRTNGRINRFYIGRSTGWIPVYLEILTNRSAGGVKLFTEHRKFRAIL